jgi:hypothetical protein
MVVQGRTWRIIHGGHGGVLQGIGGASWFFSFEHICGAAFAALFLLYAKLFPAIID